MLLLWYNHSMKSFITCFNEATPAARWGWALPAIFEYCPFRLIIGVITALVSALLLIIGALKTANKCFNYSISNFTFLKLFREQTSVKNAPIFTDTLKNAMTTSISSSEDHSIDWPTQTQQPNVPCADSFKKMYVKFKELVLKPMMGDVRISIDFILTTTEKYIKSLNYNDRKVIRETLASIRSETIEIRK